MRNHEDESAADVLERLLASPPRRQKQKLFGGKVDLEPLQSWTERQRAYRMAIEREEQRMAEGR